MKNISTVITAAAATLGLLAVVVFGGRLITTGSVCGIEPNFNQVVQLPSKADASVQVAVADVPFVATAKAGKRVAGKCKACHSFKAGDKSKKTGPNLFGIWGRDIATMEGFKYSPAFQAKSGEIVWSEETLTAYITKPKDYIPGNKMAFPGLKKEQDRQNLMEYLKTLK